MEKREKASGCTVQPILQTPEKEFPKEWGRPHLRGLKGETRGQEEEIVERWHAGK